MNKTFQDFLTAVNVICSETDIRIDVSISQVGNSGIAVHWYVGEDCAHPTAGDYFDWVWVRGFDDFHVFNQTKMEDWTNELVRMREDWTPPTEEWMDGQSRPVMEFEESQDSIDRTENAVMDAQERI